MINKENTFFEKQKELIDLCLKILAEKMPEYEESYKELYYGKKIPPHIAQPLQALKNKIAFKPLYEKIQKELGISTKKARNLVEKYGFTYVLNNLDKLKEIKNKKISRKMVENSLKENQEKLF